ncbi:hypothetical protein JW752_02050 [Candidatus Peregrinibacteria bacterium]|nr:hypothetical protein [Candidatus Peregrinibacteria bacterium]
MKITIETPAFIVSGKKWIPVALYDKLAIKTINERKIHLLKTKGYKIPTNDENPVFKAAAALQKLKPNKFGVKIGIEKNIPTFSGLHSQLSNAAGALIALNQLWGFNLPNKKLSAIAKTIDPKMPAILKIFFSLPETSKKIVLIRPKHILIDPEWAKNHNPPSYFPDLKALVRILKEQGAESAGLSGKRSMVFGQFKGPVSLKTSEKTFRGKTDFIWIGSACNKGAELID